MKAIWLVPLIVSLLQAADIAGKWAGTVDIPEGRFQVALSLEQKGDEISGTIMASGGGSYPIQKGRLTGNKLSFEVPAEGQVYVVECAFENDRLTGDIKPSGGGSGKIDISRSN
jgi:hypothetical protein